MKTLHKVALTIRLALTMIGPDQTQTTLTHLMGQQSTTNRTLRSVTHSNQRILGIDKQMLQEGKNGQLPVRI